ncbi:hypothetical protein BUALT_Bualt06G0130100 [Buddleja alternifolia]|uniref:Protein kinase domain-containing protein n=1 Tax=Buddleja alternifolia TaxID=168488 RepID=A0AAV6XQX5_9LAMI|nr:hypothetical protein BUALT_Bualt06G0130100 [Buddleja alternifolia]
MSTIYDNWERLVAAVLRKQQLWQLFHEQSRSPSIRSEDSDSSSSSFRDVDFAISGSSSTYWQELEEAVAKSQKLLPKLVVISDFRAAFDVEKVLFASAELLGRGTFGSVYAAVMDNGVRIVVKRLNSVSISELEFKRHMDIVANVWHENVAPLRAYYSSSDEKLMLYDYHSNGSMYALLHGQSGENMLHVEWETRLRIAIGAARGIAAIHSQNGGKLVHGNIKSSNIFLNPKHYGCVSDLGIANMTATTFMPMSWCYAPEVKNTQNVSQASDVYSFGILLLELLTRKPPVHVPGRLEPVNLVKLVSSVKSKDITGNVFDADLLKHPAIREQMVKVLQIGISCVAKSIKERPKMSELVNMLEDLGKINTGNRVSSTKRLVFVEEINPTFDLEEMLGSSAEFLGKGSFGTSYKTFLENGSTIVVKRLKDVNVSPKEFQQHMEVIGRIRHENIAGLRAYYYSRDEKLLVYDYYNQGNVSALLHGKRGIEWTPVSWETRLQIAIGAARGIAHIHRQDGQKLVHGNIKSSNIFLNEQRYGIISDAGVANVSRPIRRSAMPTPDYLALELEDTKKVSQASDVFSFGVVLLELLTGKPSQHIAKDGEVIPLVEWVKSVIANHWLVFDIELLRHQNDHEAIDRVLQIAMDCVNVVPESRPKMNEVVKMLEEISGIDTWGPPSIESRLEYLLEDLLPTLTLYIKISSHCVNIDLATRQTGENLTQVDWETRLRVAIGAARGIAEIHSQNGGKLVHGNIKSSNIFLNEQHYGCVSDLGLTNIIETTFMPTARCYAPEVKSTQNVSQESDVYSFGILLLELLTRKSLIHVPGGPDAVNLVKLVNSIKSKARTSRVFDADLLKLPTIRERMVKVLQIGINCIAKSTKKRPKMSEVVNMLENLGRMNTRSSVSLKGKLVFVDDGNPTFEFEDMLRASADVLGKGTFGISYRAELDTAVVVKRMKEGSVTFEEFQQHIEVIGRMRHDNVAELKAYYFNKDEVLLVYDYLDQESASALLHGKIGTDGTTLYWETRLQIAIGAARGIAHIHRQDNRKLIHGNIKSSNIFLNEQRYGIISDAGVANVSRPIRCSAMPTPGYLALELEDTKKVSQASDVFSFGVVLLELLTGKPSQHIAKDGEVISLVEWVKSVIANHWLVFDIELLRHQNDHEAIDRVLQIAMDCVNVVPESRPKMNEVVKMLEEISGIDMWGPPSIELRLEYLLEDLLPTLTL